MSATVVAASTIRGVGLKRPFGVRVSDEIVQKIKAISERYGTSDGGSISMLVNNEIARLTREESFDWRKAYKSYQMKNPK